MQHGPLEQKSFITLALESLDNEVESSAKEKEKNCVKLLDILGPVS
jgi:hypothetical protein